MLCDSRAGSPFRNVCHPQINSLYSHLGRLHFLDNVVDRDGAVERRSHLGGECDVRRELVLVDACGCVRLYT